MTILRIYIAVLLLLCSLAGGAQVRPDQFPLETNPNNSNFETYSQKNGVNTRASLLDLKEYFTPNVDSAWQAFTFTDSIGIADSLRMMFVKDNRGRVFYVDADGDALLLKDTAQAVGNVYALATLADTSTVASPVEGDIAVIGSDTLLFYETYWLMFAGGAGGIYGGSGTVPAGTYVEQLGSLRFDIDSFGSFTVGDLDEVTTGAYISISNTGGNDGAIVMKSGSGKGTTDATIELNNYQLPGTTPTGEGLPAGDYMWIVSQAGVRKGQDSTGWIHIDSLLNGYTTGSGTAGTLPIWTGASTLGNSSLTESGGNILSTSFTGAFGIATGTTAQAPVGANGRIRYNTTENGISAWNGAAAAWQYLPWADVDNWASGNIPYSDGSKLTSSANLAYISGEFRLGGGGDEGNYIFQVTNGNASFDGNTIEQVKINTTTTNGGSGTIKADVGSNTNTAALWGEGLFPAFFYSDTKHTSENAAGVIFTSHNSTSWSNNEILPVLNHQYGRTSVSTATTPSINGTGSGYSYRHVFRHNGSGPLAGYQRTGASIFSRLEQVQNIGPPVLKARVAWYFQTEWDSIVGNRLILMGDGATFPDYTGGITGTHATSASFTSAGKLIQVPEKWGAISTSTDGSGDITVAHGMGVTPTVVDIQFTGTSGSATPYVYVVLIDGTDATNFTIRVFDMTGAAVTSTAVTATWHCKT